MLFSTGNPTIPTTERRYLYERGNYWWKRMYGSPIQGFMPEIPVRCKGYSQKAKQSKGIGQSGSGTVSHKLMRNALNEIKGSDIRITRSHTSSMSALKHILDEHFG